MPRLALVVVTLGLAVVSGGTALADPASPDEVKAAIDTFYPGMADAGPIPMNADLSGTIAEGLDGSWYRPDILGSVDPERVGTMCDRFPIRIATAPNEITLLQESKPAPVTYRYTYVGGSLYSEWVDIPALFARLGLDKVPEDNRRQMEMNVLRSSGGFVVIVRPSANTLWMYSLAGGPRLYARCG